MLEKLLEGEKYMFQIDDLKEPGGRQLARASVNTVQYLHVGDKGRDKSRWTGESW